MKVLHICEDCGNNLLIDEGDCLRFQTKYTRIYKDSGKVRGMCPKCGNEGYFKPRLELNPVSLDNVLVSTL